MKHLIFLLLAFGLYSLKINAQESFPIPDSGVASFYADKFNGKKTANGETYNPKDFTAAHKMLPFNTIVRVTNLKNNYSVVVRINDRGPFSRNRVLDLSKAAAKKIDLVRFGHATVKLEIMPDTTDIEFENSREHINNPFISGFDNFLSELPHSNDQMINMEMAPVNIRGYGIQIKSFSDDVNAVYFCNELKKQLLPEDIFIMKTKHHQKTVFRVIAGNFSKEKDARELLSACKNINKDSFVKKLRH